MKIEFFVNEFFNRIILIVNRVVTLLGGAGVVLKAL